MKKTVIISIALMLSSLFTGCNEDESSSLDCSEIACTLQFISYWDQVKYPDGSNVALDRFNVIDKNSGEDLTRNFTQEELIAFQAAGSYPLYDDLTDAENPGISRTIVFQGFLGEIEIVSEEYLVGTDCCHAGIPEGNLDIIVD